MQVLHGLTSLNQLPPGSALSVGNFDGVHRGHQKIAETLCGSGRPACVVVTFEPHPVAALRPDLAPPRLSTADQKRGLLERLGVTHLVVLPGDKSVLSLSARAFYDQIADAGRPGLWVEGGDFRFGKGASGNVGSLREWGANVEVVEPATVVLPGLQVVAASSSLTRWLLAHGRVADAAALLGRDYAITGAVVGGERRGRQIGFPTANVDVLGQLIPADGVYAATAVLDHGTERPAALSIGTNPTFDGPARTVEAHLLDFDGDLYGRPLTLRLRRWLREQERYPGVDALVAQLRRDVAATRAAA